MSTTDEERNMEVDPEETTDKIWCDGCYDLAHFGHANSLRQAKGLGKRLLVGVHSDEEITKNKGCPPVMLESERYEMVRAIKWVDEVIENAPYVTTLATLDNHGCLYCAHGEDITTDENGNDTYQKVKDAGRYKDVNRTQGISTTQLVKRMLARCPFPSDDIQGDTPPSSSPYTGGGKCPFLLTTRKIQQFTSDFKDPPEDANVVYVDGTFDIFHPGHLRCLQKAKALGDFLIVGVHDDETCKDVKEDYPIMNLNERVQSLLACRYVDEVVIGAPYYVSEELLEHFNVSTVVHGNTDVTPIIRDPHSKKDPYEVPKKLGIFEKVDSGTELTTEDIIDRVIDKKDLYTKRNARKEAAEVTHLIAQTQPQGEE